MLIKVLSKYNVSLQLGVYFSHIQGTDILKTTITLLRFIGKIFSDL